MSDREVVLSTRAYAKMVLHAAKYPHAAVSGLLIAEENSGDARAPLEIVDAVPLFHQCLYVSPMYEIALTQVETRASAAGCAIAGMYGACENRMHNSPDRLADARVTDKVAELVPGALLALLDNRTLAPDLPRVPLSLHYHTESGWRPKAPNTLIFKCAGGGAAVGELLRRGAARDLIDFDNHLDDLTLDYTNSGIDKLLHTMQLD